MASVLWTSADASRGDNYPAVTTPLAVGTITIFGHRESWKDLGTYRLTSLRGPASS